MKYFGSIFCFKLNIFTSKISNLLLPVWAEGAGGCESYPTSEIPNKYIYDAFLMIYLFPKFSKLHDIVTPPRLLELLFDDVLADMIFGFTKLYSHIEKAGISFEITNEKVCLFLSMLLLSGSHKLPDRKMYWEAVPDTFV